MRFKTATLLILLALLPLSTTDSQAQKRRRSKTSSTTQKSKPKEDAPVNADVKPEKTATQLLIEKDMTALSQLTPEKKDAVYAAMKAVDHAMQLYEIRSYNSLFLDQLREAETEKTLNKGLQALPETTLKSLLAVTYNAVLDAWTADTYYTEQLVDNKLLQLAERYGLRGTSGSLLGGEIYKKASVSFALAVEFAKAAQIIK